MTYTQRGKNLNPGLPPAIQPAPRPQSPASHTRRRKPQNPWVMPWVLRRKERRCGRTLLSYLINTDIPAALDGKHVAMKKPEKSGSEYCNYKGFFCLVLLALVDTEYRFLWVDVGSSGSSSGAQIFNCSKLKKKITDGREGQICTTISWVMTPSP